MSQHGMPPPALAGLRAAARALELDPGPLLEAAAALGDAPGDVARITMSWPIPGLALLCPWPDPDEALRALHRTLGDPIQTGTLPALLARPETAHFVEVERWAEDEAVTISIHAVGCRFLDEDLRMLEGATIFQPSASTAIRDAAGALGQILTHAVVDRARPRAANLWTFRFFMLNATPEQRAADRESLRVLAERLGVHASHRALLEAVHPKLAADEPYLASIVGCFDAVMPCLLLKCFGTPVAKARDILREIYGDSRAADRLEAFAASLRAPIIESLELRFWDEDVPRLRVSLDAPATARPSALL